MNLDFIGRLPMWGVFLVTLLVSWGAAEIGFRFGRYRQGRDHGKDGPGSQIVGTTVGLLAFMLAFTFGLAASRFEARRGVLLAEANAIGTAYLRAKLLPPPLGAEAQERLREYVGLRIVNDKLTPARVGEMVHRSEELQRELWQRAMAATSADARSVPAGLFAEAMNDVIDLHETRMMAGLRTRIPPTIWAALWVLAGISLVAVGHEAGLSGSRSWVRMTFLVLAFATVTLLIADLDDPIGGFLKTNQQALIDTRESLRAFP